MNQARGFFGIAAINNGKAIAYGGYGAGGSSSIYDPSAGTWSTGPNLVNSRTEFASSLLNDGTVLVVGGVNGSGSTSEIYNPTTNTWTLTTGNLSIARNALRTIKLNNGNVLAIGGCTNATTQSCSTSASTSIELYNATTQTWSTVSGMVTGRRVPSLNLLNNGKVLIVGGKTVSNGEISSAEIYDPLSNTSIAIPNAPAGVSSDWTNFGQGVLLPNGKVLYAGISSSTYIYDPVVNTWSSSGSLSKSYYSATPILLKNGKVLLASGYDGGTTNYSSAEIYTPDLSEKIVSTDDSSLSFGQTDPKISADTTNSYSYVTWSDSRLTSPSDTTTESNIYMQKLDGSGNPAWPNGLGENGSYNVRDVRIDTTRGSLNTTVQAKPAIAKSVFTNTSTDVPVQIAWTDNRDGTPATSIYGQSYNTRNYSMSSTNWTAYYYVTGSPSSANSISVQVGATEADGETMSYTSASSTYTGDTTNGEKSTVFSNLPPSGDTSLTNRRIVLKLTYVTGSMQIQYNGASTVADTRIDVGTVVPERSLILVLIIPALPLLAFKKRILTVRRNKVA